jgi:hypothetical protein
MPGGCVTAGESHPPKIGEMVKRHTGSLSRSSSAPRSGSPHGFLNRENAVDVSIDGTVAKQRQVEFAECERDQLVGATRMAQLDDEFGKIALTRATAEGSRSGGSSSGAPMRNGAFPAMAVVRHLGDDAVVVRHQVRASWSRKDPCRWVVRGVITLQQPPPSCFSSDWMICESDD